jgi:zinc/manganese transport system permease protein
MTDLVDLMAAPFVVCVILVGIHAYLGLHVIQRKVIFVDLALAQIAALGATSAFLLGISPHSRTAYFFALGFAIVGAAIFSLTRMRTERVPQEAIIGIVYAVALATAILVADRAPEGAEHIKESLVGAVLWVSWPTVAKTAIIYSLVGALHIIFRHRFLQISFAPEQAYAEGRWIRGWDFLFYVTFAFVITSSVAIAGVLLVFTFLVIPAVIATLFATRIGVRLAIGWAVGIAACLIGMVASYRFDMPSGPAVVASLGVALVLAALLIYIVHAPRKRWALLKVAAGVAIVAGMLAAAAILAHSGAFLQIAHQHDWEHEGPHHPGHEHSEDGSWDELWQECEGNEGCLVERLRQHPHRHHVLAAHLAEEDPVAREAAVDLLEELLDEPALDLLAQAAAKETDDLLRLRLVEILASRGDHRAFPNAVELLGADTPPLVRDEAHQLLLTRSGQDYGYDPFASPEDSAEAVAQWRDWAARKNPRASTAGRD